MRRLGGVLVFLLLLSGTVARASDAPLQAAVAAAHPLATAAGMEILSAGGNAFDAAVAVTAALGVVEPFSAGLGGGGFWLLHRASDGRQVVVDGRERAPLSATADMYLDTDGRVTKASLEGPSSAAIPGVPAALEHLSREYGRLPLTRSLAPAIRLAREGFEVTARYRTLAGSRLPLLRRYHSTATLFLKDGEVPPLGYRIRQPDLAGTLERLAESGAADFYRGRTADLMVTAVGATGGIWTPADLASYQIKEREPIVGYYRGARVVSTPPPSSGGVALMTMLNILGRFDLSQLDPATRVHISVEAMRRAYRDRAEYLGDPDYWPVPVADLVGGEHAAELASGIDLEAATPSESLPSTLPPEPGSTDTTHFSILDREGNRVAATVTINYPFGSGFVVPGTGVLLNDEMDDFSAKPGTPNAYGLIGGDANSISAGKRPLSSMTPTFIEMPDRLALLGTPGGSRIITMVLLSALDFIDGGEARSMVGLPRFHHQYLPDRISYEEGAFASEEVAALSVLGHDLAQTSRPFGNMQAVVWDRFSGIVSAASDPRGEGAAEVR